MTTTTYAYVPFPAPTPADPCDTCGGQGVTGDRYEMPTDTGQRLLVEVFCPACKGCGNGSHEQCKHGAHADDEFELGDVVAEDACPSCDGRGWTPVPGWSASDPGAVAVVLMRVPCGCTEGRAQLVDDPDELEERALLGASCSDEANAQGWGSHV
ncbi:hypothetical protein [Microtetraspora glauca]|uniref:Uncharacterized protein n=1 Tax=Microtetraspora glauca TaxID=1996 RepID=A0ABV3GA26_MICGL